MSLIFGIYWNDCICELKHSEMSGVSLVNIGRNYEV